jgi:hypothetical protein
LFANAAALVSVPKALNQIAIVDTAFREWERVAHLLGASEGLAESQGTPLEDRLSGERAKAEARALLELGAARFRLAYDRGRSMSMEQAIEYALDADDCPHLKNP